MNLSSKLNIDFQAIQQLEAKELKIRKKIDIFVTKTLDNKTTVILQISQKSRFLQKDVDKIEEILHTIEKHQNTIFENKYIVIEAPLCSKAKAKFENLAWDVFI